jgi:hypothetical protein
MLYFAWISDPLAPFDPVAHAREDLQVFRLRIHEQTGMIPIVECDIRNPGIAGLLTRTERYALISEMADGDDEPVLLARGRLVGVPTELASDPVTIELQCVPENEDDVLRAAADAIRVGEVAYDPDSPDSDAEAYDPLFVGQDGDEDPQTALDGRLEEWRWDRRNLALSRSSMISGPLVDIGSNALDGSVSAKLLDPPKSKMRLRVIASWTQEAKGVQTYPIDGGNSQIDTYTYDDLISRFPQPGTPIGADTGWTLAEASIKDLGGTVSFEFDQSTPSKYPAGALLVMKSHTLQVNLRAAYDYRQQREEILDIVMLSGCQDVLGDDKTESVEVINLNNLSVDIYTDEWTYEDPDTLKIKTYAVGDTVTAYGRTWVCVHAHGATEAFQPYKDEIQLWQRTTSQAAMKDLRNPRFFDSNRGRRAARHAIRRLRRKLVQRARALEISFELAWPLARLLTTDHQVRIEYRHLPGGESTGKVREIELTADDRGRRIARVVIGVLLGSGAVPTQPVGSESTDGVVYTMSGKAPRVPVDAYSLADKAPTVFELVNNAASQTTAMLVSADPEATLASMPTVATIGFEPLREEDLLPRRLSVVCQPPEIPAGINLTAEV